MSARETAMAAREVALQARAEREEQARVEREAEEARRRDEETARYERAYDTISMSPLEEWFPGEKWDIMDYSDIGTAIGIAISDGSSVVVAPRDRSVRLLLKREKLRVDAPAPGRPDLGYHYEETGEVKVYAVEVKPDTGMSAFNTGYDYYDGPEVTSPADVGDWIAAHDKS